MPARPSSLPDVRAAVDALLARRRWREEHPGDLVLAVCEAVENAIEHGSPPGEPIDVEVVVSAEGARVSVADVGRPDTAVPGDEPTAPPLDAVRGRGRLIMRELADRVEVRRDAGGTVVQLDFRSCAEPTE